MQLLDVLVTHVDVALLDCQGGTATCITSNYSGQICRICRSNDTATTNQYPADNGLRTNRLTFSHGGESWTGGPTTANTDVGIRGFIYTGGNLTFNSLSDVAGSVWVVGNVVNNDTSGERVLVFYEPPAGLPVLNVVLGRLSWDETVPSSTPWP